MAWAKERLLVLCVYFTIAIHAVSSYTVCPEGYCRHSNGCYLVIGLEVSWIDAKSYCTQLGGALLSIKSVAMNSAAEGALRRSIGTVSPGKFWLDFTDLLNPLDWREMRSRKALTYTNWDPLEVIRNDTENRNCVAMSESRDYTWTAEDCGSKLNFVCYSSGKEVNPHSYNYRYQQNRVEDDDVIEC